ncbi:alkylated DNA repair protein alkB-like protein 1 [Nematocida sp. AWRm77]|nr:alkylated DNA repair protein alkB-like protein 1 [Nematocida sp. AWRm77]
MGEHYIREVEKMHMHTDTLPTVNSENAHLHCTEIRTIETTSPSLKKKITVYLFEGNLAFIPSPLRAETKKEIVGETFTKLLYPPYKNSIDRALDLSGIDLYKSFCDGTEYVFPKMAESPKTNIHIKQNPYVSESEKKEVQEALARGEVKISPSDLIKKIRWSSLGIYYDWEKKAYDPTVGLPMPACIERVCQDIAKEVCSTDTFRAETAIVNYYQKKDRIMTHVDRYEEDMEKPLISFSFGCSAVFVVGKQEKDDPRVTTFLLQDGDVVILQNESRKYLHGIPKILSENTGDKEYQHTPYYPLISDSRINISVRQAYK